MLLTVEKLIYGGDGLARLPSDAVDANPQNQRGRGKAVFVPFVLSGEGIQASLTEQKPGFARANADAIVRPSPHRVQPLCPYFSRCGGCHYQHASYEHQLEVKKEILRETLRRTARIELNFEIEVHPSPPWNYRNRSRLQVQTQPAFAAGYFGLASHELQPVEECPISSPLINHGIAALWRMGRAGKVAEGVREIEFFANADSELLVEVHCNATARRAAVRAFTEELITELPGIIGVVAFRDGVGEKEEKIVLSGVEYLTYQTQRSAYRVSAGAFFQTNRHLTDELVRIVTDGQSGSLALDLYAGVGLFSTVLARDFRHIVSVESSQPSTADLAYNRPANTEVIQATTAQYLAVAEKPGQSANNAILPRGVSRPDLVVVDPPRSGLGQPVAQALTKLAALRVVYVSCDPATLARDLTYLLPAGYRIERVHLVDLFPQTYHIESVVHLTR